MMQFIRDHANSKFAKFLFLGIGISFLGFGGAGFFNQSGSLDVAKVNGEKINQFQVEREYSNLITQFGGMSPNEAEMAALKKMALSRVVERLVLQQKMAQWKVTVSNEELAKAIFSEEAFFDAEGKFSRDIYRQLLARQGLSEEDFENSIRSELSMQVLIRSIMGSNFVGDTMLNDYAAFDKERRSFEIVEIPFEGFRDQVAITDEAVQAEFAQNSAQYQTKARLKIEYIELSEALVAKDVAPTEAQLSEAIAQAQAQAQAAETRDSDQLIIQFDNPEEQTAALAALTEIHQSLMNQTLSFDAAKEQIATIKDGQYFATGIVRKGADETPFNQQLFALTKVGEISKPFINDTAVHLVRLLNINASEASAETLAEEAREKLLKSLYEQAYAKQEARLQELSEQHVDSLTAIANELGLEVVATDWLAFDAQEGLLSSETLREALLTDSVMKEGKNSFPFVHDGKAMMVRVIEHEPVRQQTLEEAFVEVKEKLVKAQLNSLALAKAEELKAVLNNAPTAFKDQAVALVLLYYQQEDLMISEITTIQGLNDFKIMAILSAFKAPIPTAEEKTLHIEALENGIAVAAVSKVVAGALSDYSPEEKNARREALMTQANEMEMAAFIKGLMETSKIDYYNNSYMNE